MGPDIEVSVHQPTRDAKFLAQEEDPHRLVVINGEPMRETGARLLIQRYHAEPDGSNAQEAGEPIQLGEHLGRRTYREPESRLADQKVKSTTGIVENLLSVPGDAHCGIQVLAPPRYLGVRFQRISAVLRSPQERRNAQRPIGAELVTVALPPPGAPTPRPASPPSCVAPNAVPGAEREPVRTVESSRFPHRSRAHSTTCELGTCRPSSIFEIFEGGQPRTSASSRPDMPASIRSLRRQMPRFTRPLSQPSDSMVPAPLCLLSLGKLLVRPVQRGATTKAPALEDTMGRSCWTHFPLE